jgi:hypothetical protein
MGKISSWGINIQMNTIAQFLDHHNIVIELFLVGIMCGMVAMIEWRNYLINQLKEENEDLRKIIRRRKNKNDNQDRFYKIKTM